ncbi:MAG: peptidoglycan-binding domain-containing protein, partial [Rhodoblastus sp.]
PAQQRAEPRRSDAIGGLIEKTAASSSTKAREPAAAAAGADDVRAAQRALQRLGFVVRPSGVFDTATRQAIAQFEREHKMPERGELTPTVKRELARLSSGET